MTEFVPEESSKKIISVIIPFYNRERFLAEAIESILAQTQQNWQLILVDDGSTDRSRQIAQNFVNRFPQKISLYRHEDGKNHGASSSRNLGIRQATGDYLTFLDSDDVLLPDALETQAEAFARNPAAEVVCGTLQYWFSWAEKGYRKERDFVVNLGFPTGKLYEPPVLLIHSLQSGGRKPGIGCAMLKRELAAAANLFKDEFQYLSEDQIFWAKISLAAKIYVLDKCLIKYRQHLQSSSSRQIKDGTAAIGLEKFTIWLENFIIEQKIENAALWNALKIWQKESFFRRRYKRLINSYQNFVPFYLRYRIRDLLVKWNKKFK